MQSIKNCKKFFAIILLSLFLNSSCGTRQYKYLALSPVEPGSRKAYEGYESVKEGDVEIEIARSFSEIALEKIKGGIKENEYPYFKKVLREIDKTDCTLFSLKVKTEQNKKLIIDPENLTLEFLGKLTEKEFKPLKEKDFYNLIKMEKLPGLENLNSYFLISEKPLEIKNNQEIFLVFPYKIKDEHMAKITLKNLLIDDKKYDFEYLFYSADRYEKAKRVAKYVGMGTGLIVIVVAAIAAFTN